MKPEINLKEVHPQAEQLIRQQMYQAPIGTYTSQDLQNRPKEIIRKFGGDAASLREMGIEVKEPDPVQRFQDSFLDLKKTPQAYERFTQLTESEPNPNYEGKTLPEALHEITSDQSIFPKLKQEEKQAAVDNVISDYEQIARGKLTNEFPVLLHEIDVQSKNKDRNFQVIPTQSLQA